MMPASKILYVGTRVTAGHTLVGVSVEGEEALPLRHDVRHSPDGFEWGYEGSGPAELARCILLDFCKKMKLDHLVVDEFYQEFKRDFVQGWHENSWAVGGEEIERWLNSRATQD